MSGTGEHLVVKSQTHVPINDAEDSEPLASATGGSAPNS